MSNNTHYKKNTKLIVYCLLEYMQGLLFERGSSPGAPLTYFTDGGSEGFFGSEILAKRDIFESMKDTGIFWVVKKTQGFFGYCTFHQLKSRKCNLLLVWDFLGYAKNVGIFLGRQILKLGFFGV